MRPSTSLTYVHNVCVFLQDEYPDLTEEQLLCLLDECELTESWSQDPETTDATPQDLKDSH